MVDRMMRAARGDIELYEQVESSPSLTGEAYTIVGIVAALSALGALLAGLFSDATGGGIGAAIFSGVWVFLGYLIWSYLTYFIGTRVFNGTADPGELQRTLGYAMTPQILSGVLNLVPLIGWCLAIFPAVWSLYLGIVAVRQALDFDTTKALMTAGIGWLVQLVAGLVIAGVLTAGAVGLGAITGG